jgi:hypothetical protein
MLRLHHHGVRLCDGLSRRDWLHVGGIGLGGLTLPRLLQARAHAAESSRPPTAKSVIVLFNSGGIPHHESFDPKPEAPEAVRGPFAAIPTRTPGLLVGELIPRTAQLTDRMAVIRTMVTGDNAHSTSGYQMLTGMPHVPLNRENAAPGKPNDWPSLNALVQALRPSQNGLPASIVLPRLMAKTPGRGPMPDCWAASLIRGFWSAIPPIRSFRPPDVISRRTSRRCGWIGGCRCWSRLASGWTTSNGTPRSAATTTISSRRSTCWPAVGRARRSI